MFGPAKGDKDSGRAAAGWSIHGEERSHAALQAMPEWAEVILRSDVQSYYLH